MFLESTELNQKNQSGGKPLIFVKEYWYYTYIIENSPLIVMYAHLVSENSSGLNDVLLKTENKEDLLISVNVHMYI